MSVWTCTDHDGVWVGVASVVVADTEEAARKLLDEQLRGHGLKDSAASPYTLEALDLTKPKAVVLQNGDY